jgi:hypothetical protein
VNAPGTADSGASVPPPQTAAAPAQADAAAGPEPQTVADIFPPGAEREAVINNCSACHNLACAAIDQRAAERWDAIRDSHRERVQGADVDAMFAYLKAHFDATKPKPNVPARFLEGGCTPF